MDKLNEALKKIDDIEYINQEKVLASFIKNKVSTVHLQGTTGYGYDDIGREVIEKIYADIFKTEDALVRIQFVNGTHAISTALFANLVRGDKFIYVTGMPYDTLYESIGITENKLSLKNMGVEFDHIDLKDDTFDTENILKYITENKVKMVCIQRSRGYSTRKSLTVKEIDNVITKIKEVDNNIIILVDNCYGEFSEDKEPTKADMLCGSLIKNIGGGVCKTGGYIVGKKEYIENCSERLTCPGIGKECGATLSENENILKGLFFAPTIVAGTIKGAIYLAYKLEEKGFQTLPKFDDKRTDIVQSVIFNDKDKLIKFIQKVQKYSPIDSHVTPMPWAMPGYNDEVIMAAGTFVQGASIELSADAPIRPPYIAYVQGGLSYSYIKVVVDNIIREL